MGLGPDNRVLLYLGDTWKIKSNLSLTYGLRYDRDTGRTDSQFPAIRFKLTRLILGLGNPVRQPNTNFAPQVGFAWDPTKSGKTSIRGGIGLFFENAIWNNVLFDGPPREKTGAFLQFFGPCSAPGQPVQLQTVNGPINTQGSAVPPTAHSAGAQGASTYPSDRQRRGPADRPAAAICRWHALQLAGAESGLRWTIPDGLHRGDPMLV